MAIPVQHGDVVLIQEGYHPVVKAPGTNAYYLNVLAGDVRKISVGYVHIKDVDEQLRHGESRLSESRF